MKLLAHTSYRSGRLQLNGAQVASADGPFDLSFPPLMEAVELDPMRAARADRPAQLALLTIAPFFLKGIIQPEMDKGRIGIIHMSRHGCLDPDMRYHGPLREDGHAGPALFVRTLPNIPMGEITIQFGLHGSGQCLLAERPDVLRLYQNAEILMDHHGMAHVICGWSDIFAEEATATFLLLSNEGTEGIDALVERSSHFFNEH